MNIKDSIVNIMVTDMDKSVAFYQTLGLSLKQRWDNYYAIVDSPSVKIGLHPSEPRDSSNQVSIGFIIDDIEAAKTLLEENDIAYSLEKDENSGTYLNFSDPDGAKLYYHLPSW
jgi:catechol 2,3-dioxygenase-like lactoylglutathione lyase family enzyme